MSFPRYTDHNSASCFNCGGDFYDEYYQSTGSPGRGQFLVYCRKCSEVTYYDLLEPTNAD